MSRAVTSGVLTKVSPSQVTTYSRCARKWWLEKVAGLPSPQTTNQAEGERIHSQIEGYYLEGRVPEHPSVRRLLEHPDVPARSPDLLIEHPNDFELKLIAAGVRMRGRIDLVVPPAAARIVRIIDWKSASDFKWNKTAEELAFNTQLVVYAAWALAAFPDAAFVQLAHGYVLKTGVGADFVETEPLDRTHVAQTYAGIEGTVAKMKVDALATDAEAVPGNPAACGDYRGCPYREVCSIGRPKTYQTFFGEVTTSTSGLLEVRMSLKDRLAALNATPVPVTEATTPTRAVGINPPDAALPDVVRRYVPPGRLGELRTALHQAVDTWVDGLTDDTGD
jgi:CRISPR/Cas system-associated exonuclease Cas4 (RecB family)